MRRLPFIILLVALVGAGFAGTYFFMRSPQWTLYQVGKAIYKHDSRLFLTYVDVGEILRSQKEDIVDLILPDQKKDQQRDMVRQLLSAFMGALIEQARDRVIRIVADTERQNLPSSWTLVAAASVTRNGDNALAVLSNQDDRLRLGLRRQADGYWRVVQINPQDLRALAAKHLLPGLIRVPAEQGGEQGSQPQSKPPEASSQGQTAQ